MVKEIEVGNVKIGGEAPVRVQSMINTDAGDVRAATDQILRLERAGCEIVRMAVPDMATANAIAEIKREIHIPLVADIHYDYRLAVRAAEAGADKIRINPGNIGGAERVRTVVRVCREKGIPIRIGVNGGSIQKEILDRHGGLTAEAMLEAAMYHVKLLNTYEFDNICISVKTSSVPLTIASYRLLAERTEYPLHLGVTEAGTEYMGIIKSAIGIGTLLCEGIGSTIRVSLTADPEREVEAGIAILKAVGLRKGSELISCPTCGRCKYDMIPIAEEVQRRMGAVKKPVTIAVMGCSVNGPGEASRADYGIAGGDGSGAIFKKGQVVKKVAADKLIDELFDIINEEVV